MGIRTFFPAIGHLLLRLRRFNVQGRAFDFEQGDRSGRLLHVDEAAILEAVYNQILYHIRVLARRKDFRYLLIQLGVR